MDGQGRMQLIKTDVGRKMCVRVFPFFPLRFGMERPLRDDGRSLMDDDGGRTG